MFLGVILLMFILLGIWCNSWICGFIISSDLENFKPLFHQILFYALLPFPGTLITSVRLLKIVQQVTEFLLSVK